MTNTYLYVSTYGGIDWHDSIETLTYLKEDDTYIIRNPWKVIAKDIHDKLNKMFTKTTNENETSEIRLKNIPSFEEILYNIQNKRDFTVNSDDDELSEMSATWLADSNELVEDYMFGQMSYTHTYETKKIEPANTRYLAVENFLAYSKGVPSIERIYQKPFTDIAEAETALAALTLHTDLCDSIKELVIVDITRVNQEWYQPILEIIEILETHPELNTEENFRIPIPEHLELLRNAIT